MPVHRRLHDQIALAHTDFGRALLSEFLGSLVLLAAVVGSGLMGAALAEGNAAITLLANSLVTGLVLYGLITLLGPISGAHFNPLVTALLCQQGQLRWRRWPAYAAAQCAGAIAGVMLAQAMFGRPLLEFSPHLRENSALWLAESVASCGLLLVVLIGQRRAPAQIPALVAGYITAAYWWTASTAFANPAATLARALTDSFTGIAPASVPGFVLAQCVGAALALPISHLLQGRDKAG